MSIFYLIAFTVSLTCSGLGFLVLFRNSRSSRNCLFFGICLSISLLNIFSIPAYSASDKNTIFFWTQFGSFCVNFFYAVNLHFYINLIFKKKKIILLKTVIYIPAIIVISVFALQPLSILDYVQYNGEWKLIPAYGNFWFYAASGYVLIYSLFTVVAIFLYLKKAESNKEYKQAKLLMLNFILSTVICTAGIWVIPYFNYKIQNIGPTYHLFYVIGLFYSVFRFRFMELKPSIVAEEIISHISDIVLLIDRKLRIISVNKSAESEFNCTSEKLNGKFFLEMIIDKEMVGKIFHNIEAGLIKKTDTIIRYRAGENIIVADSYISAVKDRFNDITGFLVISKENRGRRDFQRAFGITERELEVVDLTVAGLSSREIAKHLGISDRTVQSHQEHIYQKLGADGKVDLIKLSAKFNLIIKN